MKSVLIIEDDFGIRSALEEVLETHEHQVFSADHGKAALELLKSIPIPHIILLDLMMPVMTGWQFLECIKCDPVYSAIPVIVFSAIRDLNIEKLGVSALLTKPFDLDRLLETIERYIR